MCRERAALMYANLPYISSVAFVELPYLFAQVVVFVPICYFMIGAHSFLLPPACRMLTVLGNFGP